MTISNLPLSYCTNVHPGQTVAEVTDGLSTYTAAAMKKFNRPMAAGLWLARSVVDELIADESKLEAIAQTLWQHDLVCYTLNTFPYGDFHSERVKENVYLPDWANPERLNYTIDCARLLAQMMPPGSEGSLSTVPLGGTMNPTGPDFFDRCYDQLIETAIELNRIRDTTGRTIRLAVEPEPLCHLSSIPNDVIHHFTALFGRAAGRGQLEITREFVGLCLDVCHQAVEFEDIPASVDLLEASDIRIYKVHITNAVELREPAQNEAGRQALLNYVEPRYLHQTYARSKDGAVTTRLDLSADDIRRDPPDDFLQADSWRVHFHVPVYAESLGPLSTTRSDLQAALKRIATLPYAPHLEVETYTWPVMPGDGDSADLSDRIAEELLAATDLLTGVS